MRATPSRHTEGDRATSGRCRLATLVLTALATLLGVGLLTPGTAAAQDPNYVIATDTTFAPVEFQDAGGQLVGIDRDLTREHPRLRDFLSKVL
ncbi:hypothetical protein ACTWP6_18885 [Mycobacterium sp. 4D054]|uniref:hypothetical protein n=1 Tax=unclassified Mycobacterium TaxID=2642494 RepID=UPI0021F93B9B|nr:hypothetical protein KXD97_31425 [Mycobacterium sp. SMC-8]UXA12360.1 hypothetical protein KXD97_00045 [Mycobacterium sp. SMC-8]